MKKILAMVAAIAFCACLSGKKVVDVDKQSKRLTRDQIMNMFSSDATLDTFPIIFFVPTGFDSDSGVWPKGKPLVVAVQYPEGDKWFEIHALPKDDQARMDEIFPLKDGEGYVPIDGSIFGNIMRLRSSGLRIEDGE